MTGEELYRIVETYASFGDHHTGTPADWATAAWLGQELAALGATVSQDTFSFSRYVVDIELRLGKHVAEVPAVPVFYSFGGSCETADLEFRSVPARVEGKARGLDPYLGPTVADALVLAVDGPSEHPIQCNRVAELRDGPPAVIVPASWIDELAAVGGLLRFEATTEAGEAPNVIAHLGDPSNPTVIVTTPLSGWTPAAGERGTGMAVALAMAADLARDHHVRLVACSGHELDHLGLQRYLAGIDVAGAPVIHLGASVGAVEWHDGQAMLGSLRLVQTTATGPEREAIGRRVADANFTLIDPEPWAGEGANWRRGGGRVLSFLGSSSLFHTAGDVPETATTPQAMATACEVAIDAARMFLGTTLGTPA